MRQVLDMSNLTHHNDIFHLQLVNWRFHALFNSQLYSIRVTGRHRGWLVTDGNVRAVERLLANNVLEVKKSYYQLTNGYSEATDILRDAFQHEDTAMCRALIAAGARYINTCINTNTLDCEFGRLVEDHVAFVKNIPTHWELKEMYDPIHTPWPVVTISKSLVRPNEPHFLFLWRSVLPW
ncbi:hypothetical protein FN846DRAFT_909401 [Sphaerosporella brunnea]|uniref:Uncharacterized protein n=1 Tax=Sphaerosporella brunnea TaxID=1250544 RepID=A0A5J5ER96_9PEZI|nr:hypothetical protein FN846DRAFT_909401 [Sphaerosporella brunnea]